MQHIQWWPTLLNIPFHIPIPRTLIYHTLSFLLPSTYTSIRTSGVDTYHRQKPQSTETHIRDAGHAKVGPNPYHILILSLTFR